MNYNQSVTWLQSFQHQGIKLGLDRMHHLLESLNHPEQHLKVIHVAGTNGKGSVCRYISSILYEEGYIIGLYTSPHLTSIHERFSINNTLINKKDMAYYLSQIKDVVETYKDKQLNPTYFEICTCLAMLYFKEKNVDYAVFEVGLGGRFDATNLVQPIMTVITNISYDHTKILGETLEKIAFEKAGIIKDYVPLITGAKEPALHIIKRDADFHHVPLTVVDDKKSNIVEQSLTHQVISIKGTLKDYVLETSELGTYQKQNLSIAIHTIEQLQMNGIFVSQESIEKGTQSMQYPGRMKQIYDCPQVFVDGAHNPSGIKELKHTITSLFPNKKIILCFGVLKDKNYVDMIKEIKDITSTIILTESTNNRAIPADELHKKINSIVPKKQIILSKTIQEGIQRCMDAASVDDIILITGSLYTVQEALLIFQKKQHHYPNG